MPENEQDEQMVKVYKETKESLVEEEVRNSELYKTLVTTLSEFGVKIDMRGIVDTYMENSQTSNEEIKAGETPKIEPELINMILRGTIYAISKEENGVVLHENGTIDATESMKSRLIAQGKYVSGLESLSADQKNALLRQVSIDLGVAKIGNIFVDLDNEVDNSFSFKDTDKNFLNALIASGPDTNKINKLIVDEIEKSGDRFNDEARQIRERQYIDKQEDVDIYFYALKLLSKKEEDIDAKEENLAKLMASKGSDSSKYKAEDGKIDVSKIFQEAIAWKKNFLLDSEAKVLIDYRNRLLKYGPKAFEGMSPEKKENILGSALMTFQDKNAPEEFKKMAIYALKTISPDLIEVQEEGEVRINVNKFKDLFNMVNPGREDDGQEYKKIDDIRAYFMAKHDRYTFSHLEDLSKVPPELWVRRDDYLSEHKEARITSKDIVDVIKDFEQVSENYGSETKVLFIKDKQVRFEEKLGELLASFNDEDGKALSEEKKVTTVMAAYATLKEATEKFGLDLGNKELNIEALAFLEKHIKSQPLVYAKYLNQVQGENGKPEYEIKNITYSSFNRDYRGNNSKYRGNVDAVVESVREMALRELFKNSSFRDKMTKDGVEIFANNIKDSVKHLIKEALRRRYGEDKAREIIDSVKGRKSYQGIRKSSYALIKGAYAVTKGAANLITRPFKSKNSRLSLPSADKTIDVSNIEKIIKNTKNTNYIQTNEELKLIETGILLDSFMDPERKAIVIQEASKSPLLDEYKNGETGELNTKAAIAAAKSWKERFIKEKRGKALLKYNKARNEGLEFNDLSDEDKAGILRAAIMTFETFETDNNSDIRFKNLAAAVLEDIAPETVSRIKGEDGDYELKLNSSKVVELYNSVLDYPQQNLLAEIVNIYEQEELDFARAKIIDLKEKGLKDKAVWEKEEAQQREEEAKQETEQMKQMRIAKSSKKITAAEFTTRGELREKRAREAKAAEAHTEVESTVKALGAEYTAKTNAVSSQMSQKMAEASQPQEVTVQAQAPKKKQEGMEL